MDSLSYLSTHGLTSLPHLHVSYSLVHLLRYHSLTHSLAHLLAHLLSHPLTHRLINLLLDLLMFWPTHLVHLLTHFDYSLTYLLTELTYSSMLVLTHSPEQKKHIQVCHILGQSQEEGRRCNISSLLMTSFLSSSLACMTATPNSIALPVPSKHRFLRGSLFAGMRRVFYV